MATFHHVSLLTRHAQENLDFYTKVLGLRFVKNTVNQENHKMLHYYYGDYSGAPGTVVTFFVVPLLAQRHDEDHFLGTIGLKIPSGSLAFWQERLTNLNILFEQSGASLSFKDKDDVQLYLEEVAAAPLAASQVVKNDIPADKQIIGLRSTEFHVKEPAKTSEFFEKFLGWSTVNGRIQLNQTDFVEIIQTNSDKKARMGRGSMDHVAFAVKNDAALEALYQKAQDQDWEIEELVSRGYFKSLYIREPGGNRVEFATMQPGFTIDEPLETLGESFALPPFLQGQREEIEAHIYKDL
ncbi:VOC family protein [Enterococcus sp. HY326]|uniref:VOC family protein n=1 Tax=Enterococcus sp. HY326 TaxID=2971265 RepID=UPI002240C446|nr:VOC family protein [Enterococcus sp. HY326]